MVRASLGKHFVGLNKEFRYRGVETGRLENFSDAVFALAITLLLISSSPPTSFDQIKRFTWDLIPFCLCIALIILIWYEHFIFFFRYGLQNRTIVALNTLFLIIVLFYVYPLKFLAKFLLLPIASLAGQDELFQEIRSMMPFGEMSTLMIIYGTGATFIFIVLTLMYRYAFKRSDELGLNEIETFDTRTSMQTNLLMASVPALSVVLAILFRNNKAGGAISGFSYMIYPVVMFGHGYLVDKKRKQLLLNSELEKPVLHKEEPAKTEELLDS